MSQQNINPDLYKKNQQNQPKITPQYFYNGFPTQIPNSYQQSPSPQFQRYPYLNKNNRQTPPPQQQTQQKPMNQPPMNNLNFQRNPNMPYQNYPMNVQPMPSKHQAWSPYQQRNPVNIQMTRPKDPNTRALLAEQTDKQKALYPDYKSPFKNNEDMQNRLYVYHVFNSKSSTPQEDEQWKEKVNNVSDQFISRTSKLNNLYHKLIQREAQSQQTEELLFADVLLWKDQEEEWNHQKEKMKKEMEDKKKYENPISFSLASDLNNPLIDDDFLSLSNSGFTIKEVEKEEPPISLFGDSDDENKDESPK
eukprot:gene4628-8201_t